MNIKTSLLDTPLADWPDLTQKLGEKGFRAHQLAEWVFKKKASQFSQMSNLPQAFRDKLDEQFTVRTLVPDGVKKSKIDGTTRYEFKTHDGLSVSCVYLPFEDRHAICLSTQAGCAWGCTFCASGKVKFARNLTVGEILDQIFLTEEMAGHPVGSILYMGMGEPLANFENVTESLHLIRSKLGLDMGSRHVTVSTCGLVPQIEKLAAGGPKVNLAISLHAVRDDLRKSLLPKAAKWTIKELLHAAKNYSMKTKARVTFEYIVLADINDSEQDAKRLANLLRGPAQYGDYRVNLIAYNPIPGLPYKMPNEDRIERMKEILTDRHLLVRLRRPQGTDIGAGCGQLGEPK